MARTQALPEAQHLFVPGVRTWQLREPLSVLKTRHLAPQYGHRGFGQNERGLRIGRDGSGDWRIVWIGMTVRSVVDPNILLTAESHQGDRPCERLSSLVLGIFKHNTHGVWVGFVTIYHH